MGSVTYTRNEFESIFIDASRGGNEKIRHLTQQDRRILERIMINLRSTRMSFRYTFRDSLKVVKLQSHLAASYKNRRWQIDVNPIKKVRNQFFERVSTKEVMRDLERTKNVLKELEVKLPKGVDFPEKELIESYKEDLFELKRSGSVTPYHKCEMLNESINSMTSTMDSCPTISSSGRLYFTRTVQEYEDYFNHLDQGSSV